MIDTVRASATILPIHFTPGETLGEFAERFVAATRGKPPELVAVVVWRLAQRAFGDGVDEGIRVDRAEARAIADLAIE